jgi:hypothetical protein
MKKRALDLWLRIVSFFSLASIMACSCVPPVDPEEPEDEKPVIIIDDGPDPDDGGSKPLPSDFDCSTACENQRRLECELGEPTPRGASCEDVCENNQSSSIVSIRWDVEKLTKATVCGD